MSATKTTLTTLAAAAALAFGGYAVAQSGGSGGGSGSGGGAGGTVGTCMGAGTGTSTGSGSTGSSSSMGASGTSGSTGTASDTANTGSSGSTTGGSSAAGWSDPPEDDPYESDGLGDVRTVVPDDSISCVGWRSPAPAALPSPRGDQGAGSRASGRQERERGSAFTLPVRAGGARKAERKGTLSHA